MTLADTNGLLTASATSGGGGERRGHEVALAWRDDVADRDDPWRAEGYGQHGRLRLDERQARLPRRSRMALPTDRPFGKLSPNEPALEQGENSLEWDCSHSSRSSSGRMFFGRGIGGGFGSGGHEYNEAIGCASQHGANGHGFVRAGL
jgi:hypothetical protein